MSFHDEDLTNFGSSHQPVVLAALKKLPASAKSAPFYQTFVKSLMDVVLTIAAAPLILTLVGVFALLVALDGHNPFYTQERVGRNGRKFRMFKLRSMLPNADQLLKEHLANNPEARAEWALNQKLVHDPRITRVGRLIRKTSIDEMPQFLNVLLGDMSLVGPRPFTTDQVDLYKGLRYYDVRPGLTGLWQISTRHESEFASRVQFDDLYVRTLSFAGDIRILFRTVAAVARGTGC